MPSKILVVDDDIDLQQQLKTILVKKGYKVVSAYDGDEGLQKVREEKPDLIVMDVMMPVKDGFTACRELKTDNKYASFSRIPVLMLTVYPDDREKMRFSMQDGKMMEADEYMQKPFDPTELLSRVEELLKK
jgi:DNA-binding response OmpR family regulator